MRSVSLPIPVAIVLAAGSLWSVGGCSSPGKIDVDGIAGLVTAICTRHDHYVNTDVLIDPILNPNRKGERDSDLTSSAILESLVGEAYDAKHGPGSWAAVGGKK